MADQSTTHAQAASGTAGRTDFAGANATFQPITVDLLVKMFDALKPTKKLASTTGIDQAIALANVLSKDQKLGKAIEPKLSKDGHNFPDWRAALENTVRVVFEVQGYFDILEVNASPNCGKLTGVLVEASFHSTLLTSVRGRPGQEAFQLLRAHFKTASWLYIMKKWMKATKPSNPSGQLNSVYSEIELCLDEIIQRTGLISKDMLLAFLFHQWCQFSYQEIANALDARVVVDQKVAILSKTILELAGCFKSGSVPTGSVFAY
jgi:hypothetical protein